MLRPAALERHHQLDLVMQVLGQRRVWNGRAIGHNGIGGLGKIEWRSALVLAHFTDVLDVVAADAPNAAHGIELVASGDHDYGCGGWGMT